MKKKLLMIISMLTCGMMTMFAQNNRISYQAVVRNSVNQLVVNTELTVNVSLANSENGQAVYSEKHTVTSNANGLISLLIGNGTDVQGNWEDIDWSSAWVTTWIYEGQEQLASHKVPFSAVPYALHAGYADSVNQNQIANYLDQHGITNPVQSDWDVTDADNDAYIKNKPNISDSIGSYLNQSTVMSQHLERIIEAYNQDYLEQFYGDLSKMQSDWNENNTYVTSYIKNKPNISDSIGNYLTTNKYVNEDNICTTITNKCSDLFTEGQSDWNETNSTNGAYIKNKPNISDSIKFYVYNNLCSDINDLDNWSTSSPWCSVLQSDWNQTTPGFTSYIKNKPDLSVYATKDTLSSYATKDTLANYATTNALKDSLSQYVGKDKLNDYQKKADLCNDVKDCIKDTLSYYYTSEKINDTLKAYFDTNLVKQAIHDTANYLRSIMGLTANNAKITIQKNGQEVSYFTVNQVDNQDINILVPTTVEELTDAENYVTIIKLEDTLSYYTTTNRIDTLLGNYATKDTLNHFVNKDELCDEVKECINDTLSKYTTTDKIDTVLGGYLDDNQYINYENFCRIVGNINANECPNIQSDWLQTNPNRMSFIQNKPKLNDTIRAYLDENLCTHISEISNPDNLHNNCLYRLSESLANIIDYINSDSYPGNPNKAKKMQSDWNEANSDKTAYIKNKPNISDSIGNYLTTNKYVNEDNICTAIESKCPDLFTEVQSNWNETNATSSAYIQNKPNISDTITNYLKENLCEYIDAITLIPAPPGVPNCIGHLSNSLLRTINYINAHGVFDLTLSPSIMQSDWSVTDTTKTTFIKNKPDLGVYATKDTLNHFVNKDELCDEVKECIKDTLSHYTTTDKIDTLLGDYATKDTLKYYTTSDKVDTLLGDYATKDTLKYYTTSDKVDTLLNAYEKKADLCNDVKECIKDTLSKYTTTDHLDSVINKHGYLTRDSALIVMMRDSIQKVNAHVIEDSLVLATRIYKDSVALHKAIKDTAAAIRNDICDSATVCITKALADASSGINHAVDTIALNVVKDTLKAYYDTTRVKELVHDTIVKYLTINKYVNEDNICATIEDKCTNVPLKSDTNRFTNHNDFTDGSITVPSNPDAIERPSTFGACDNMNAVNVCDLLAMFDSLSNRIQGVYDSLKRVTDSLAEELNNLKNSVPPTADAPTIKHLAPTTLTVKANNTSPVSPITSYKYCYSTNADMSDAICQTSTYDTLDLSGLTPNTDYYFTVEATNIAGSTTSNITTERTPAHAPTAVVTVPLTPQPNGFEIEVTEIDPKEKRDETTVQICYKQGTSCSIDDNDYTCADADSVDVDVNNTNTQIIYGLTANTEYCVIVKVSNGDSTTTYGPFTVTTGNDVSMSITSAGGGNLNLCGRTSVPATYTATPSNGAENYTYSWNDGTSSESNVFTKSYTAAGTYTVTCTATHKTEGYKLIATATTTVSAAAAPVALGVCRDFLTVKVMGTRGNPNTINWGDGNTDSSVSEDMEHTYSESGIYTIVASNSAGCTDTVSVKLAEAAHTTCTLSGLPNTSLLPNESGTSALIDSVSDHEGNWYEVVQIGSQCWLKENLRTTTSPSTGSRIVIDNGPMRSNVSKVACWAFNDSAYYAPKNYGLLYNWMAAMDTFYNNSHQSYPCDVTFTCGEVATADQPNVEDDAGYPIFNPRTNTGNYRGICPQGWHLPTDEEWTALEVVVNDGVALPDIRGYRGSHAAELAAGCDWPKVKNPVAETPSDYYDHQRDISDLAVLPGGNVALVDGVYTGHYEHVGGHATFWSSTPYAGTSRHASYFRGFGYSFNGVNRDTYSRWVLQSVRCVRD